MANAQGVDVRQCPGQLVEVQLHQQHGQGLLALVVLPGYAVHRLGDELQDQVEVQLVRLYGGEGMAGSTHGVYETSNRNGQFKLPLFRVLLSPVIKNKRSADPEGLPGVDAFSAKNTTKQTILGRILAIEKRANDASPLSTRYASIRTVRNCSKNYETWRGKRQDPTEKKKSKICIGNHTDCLVHFTICSRPQVCPRNTLRSTKSAKVHHDSQARAGPGNNFGGDPITDAALTETAHSNNMYAHAHPHVSQQDDAVSTRSCRRLFFVFLTTYGSMTDKTATLQNPASSRLSRQARDNRNTVCERNGVLLLYYSISTTTVGFYGESLHRSRPTGASCNVQS